MHWLWAVSALRLAMQTFIVGSFGTAAGLESMPPKRAEAFIRAIREPSPPYPSSRMDFPALYSYAKERQGWELGNDVDDAVDALYDLRNQVQHFIPKAWSIEACGLPDITMKVLSAVSEL